MNFSQNLLQMSTEQAMHHAEALSDDDFCHSLDIGQEKRRIALQVRRTISEIARVPVSRIDPIMTIADVVRSRWLDSWDDIDFRFRMERKLGIRLGDLHIELGTLRRGDFATLGELIVTITNMIDSITRRARGNDEGPSS